MSSFAYDYKDEKLYLIYNADVTEVIDGYSLGIVINNPIEGLAEIMFSNDINGKVFTYDITGTIKLKDLLAKGINERLYFSMLVSVAKTLHECEKYGLNVGSLVLNEELLYCDEENGIVNFVCIPTSGFIVSIDTKEILRQFSTVLMNRMEVTNSTILEINEYLTLMESEYVYSNFIYKLNQYMLEHNIEGPNVSKKTRQTVYKEEPEKTRKPEDKTNESQEFNKELSYTDVNVMPVEKSEVVMASAANMTPEVVMTPGGNMAPEAAVAPAAVMATVAVSSGAKPSILDTIKDKFQKAIKAIVGIKDSQFVKNIKAKLVIFKDKIVGLKDKIVNSLRNKKNEGQGINQAVAMQDMNQGINQQVAMQDMNQGMNQQVVVPNMNQGMVMNNMEPNNMAYGQIEHSGSTMMLDCVTGESETGNSICTAEAYIVRVSTGEKIDITRTNFKLGRSNRRADYCVGDDDTISKVHAFITKTGNQYFLVDNSSSNRTYLDGKVLEPIKENRLRHKSKFKLAKEEFVFYLY